MSYTTTCLVCECPIFMEDDYDHGDDHRCEECRMVDDLLAQNTKESK